jgi:hypothetical protein
MVDVAVASEAVAGMLAVGGVKELAEAAGGGLVAGVVDRVKKVFGSDARSVDALERTQRDEPGAVADLASALAWYAGRDQAFAQELAGWAAQASTAGSVTQHVRAGRDAYVAGRDQTITNYRRSGELDRQHSARRRGCPRAGGPAEHRSQARCVRRRGEPGSRELPGSRSSTRTATPPITTSCGGSTQRSRS